MRTPLAVRSSSLLEDDRYEPFAGVYQTKMTPNNQPERAARQSLYLQYASPNKTAERFLPAEHLNNPNIYLPEPVLSRSGFSEIPPPRVEKKWNELFSKLLRE